MTVIVRVNVRPIIERLGISIDEILEEGGDFFVKGAVKRCPVKTGRLKGSIGNAKFNPKYRGEGIMEKLSDSMGKGLRIGTTVEYAAYVEFREDFRHITGQAHYMQDSALELASNFKRIAEGKLRWMK